MLEKDRDIELQSFVNAKVLDDDWSPLANEVKRLLDGYKGRMGIHGPFWGFTIDTQGPLRDITGQLTIATFITLGNQDDWPTYLKVFGATHSSETGKINHVIDAKGYRVIVLDSAEPGRVDGVLTDVQLVWLRAPLSEAADRPVIVVLDQNANALHIKADTIKLHDHPPFIAALKTHDDVRQVVAG